MAAHRDMPACCTGKYSCHETPQYAVWWCHKVRFKQNSNACLKSDPQLFWHNLFWEAPDKSHRFLWDILLKPFWSRPTVALPQRMGQHYSASSFWSSAYNKPCNPQLSGHRERAGTECPCHTLQMGPAKTQKPVGKCGRRHHDMYYIC